MTQTSRLTLARENDWHNAEDNARITTIFVRVKEHPELCDTEIESFYSKKEKVSRIQKFKAIKFEKKRLYFLFREIPTEINKNSEFEYERRLWKNVFLSYCYRLKRNSHQELMPMKSVKSKQGKAKVITVFELSYDSFVGGGPISSDTPIKTSAFYFTTKSKAEFVQREELLGGGRIQKKFAIKFEDGTHILLTPVEYRSKPFVLRSTRIFK